MPIYKVAEKNIESFDSIQRWMHKLKTKYAGDFDDSSTKRNTLYYMKRFCEMLGMDPDEIIGQRRADRKDDDPLIRKRHEEFVEKFNMLIRETGTVNSAQTATGHIMSFYKWNNEKLSVLSIPKGAPTRISKVPDPSELARICAAADKKRDVELKAWILCQAESGIANIDLFALTLKNISPEFGTLNTQLENGQTPIHIHIVRHKKPGLGPYDTFFGENAVETLKNYLESKPKSQTERIFNFSDRYLQTRVIKVAYMAGVGTDDLPVRPYSFRKFFNTQMRMAGVNETVIEYWMGHALGKVRGAYFVPPVQQQIEIYNQAYPGINIKRHKP